LGQSPFWLIGGARQYRARLPKKRGGGRLPPVGRYVALRAVGVPISITNPATTPESQNILKLINIPITLKYG
jgi:hypothetical protein